MASRFETETAATPVESWVAWPVYWSAVWVGTLSALAVALVIGLIGIAVGAHEMGPAARVVDWHKFGLWALVFSVVGAFFAFAVGGWIAARIAGIRRSEPAMLHGAVVWLLTVPFFLFFAAQGSGSYFGGWHGGLAGTPGWAAAMQTNQAVTVPDDVAREQARIARNSALGSVTALLLGLVGGVIGGWMASGEPMTFTHYRTRHLTTVHTPTNEPVRTL